MSEWVQTHLPCPCGQSSDAYSINDKGWGKCFSCGKNFNEEASDSTPRGKQQVAAVKELVPFGEYRALSKRYSCSNPAALAMLGYRSSSFAMRPRGFEP